MFEKVNETSTNYTNLMLSVEDCEKLRKFITSLQRKESSASGWKRRSNENDVHALIYILVVLTFCSFIIIILMAKYVRKENKDMSDYKAYEEFMNRSKLISVQQSKYMCARNFEEMLKNMDLERKLKAKKEFEKSSKMSEKRFLRSNTESSKWGSTKTLEHGFDHSSDFSMKQNIGLSRSNEGNIQMEPNPGEQDGVLKKGVDKYLLKTLIVDGIFDKTKYQVLEIPMEQNSPNVSFQSAKSDDDLMEVTSV